MAATRSVNSILVSMFATSVLVICAPMCLAIAEISFEATPVLEMRTTAEFVDEQERISGSAAVGVSFYDPNDTVQLDAAYVYFADGMSGPLEMQLATVDGRYRATFEYVPKEPVAGWIRLNLSLSEAQFLENYSIEEIAVLLTSVDNGSAYPVRWGQKAPSAFVRVYVNTEGSSPYFVIFDEAKKRHITRQCKKASKRSSFKFDRICDFPVSDILENKNTAEIIRKRGAAFGKPITVQIAYQPPSDL